MDDAENSEPPETEYLIRKSDQPLIALALKFLEAGAFSEQASWAETVTLAKLRHVFGRAPRASSAVSAEVSFTSPRMRFGTEEVYFWYAVGVENQVLAMRFGGRYYNPGSGGDSFLIFRWVAGLGSTPSWNDYIAQHPVVTRLVDPFEILDEMASVQHGVELEVVDHDNDLLDDASEDDADSVELEEEDGDDEGNDEDLPLLIGPESDAERQLIATLDLDSECGSSSGAVYGVERCDGCGLDLSTCGLFIDGRGADSSAWGNYCASCCLRKGVTLGTGYGQLYAKQPDGTWRGVAGFDD